MASEMRYPESIPDFLDRVFLAGLSLACVEGSCFLSAHGSAGQTSCLGYVHDKCEQSLANALASSFAFVPQSASGSSIRTEMNSR